MRGRTLCRRTVSVAGWAAHGRCVADGRYGALVTHRTAIPVAIPPHGPMPAARQPRSVSARPHASPRCITARAGALETVHIHNGDQFHRAVYARPASVPLLTVTNHDSVLDEPLLLGALQGPAHFLRYAVGRASTVLRVGRPARAAVTGAIVRAADTHTAVADGQRSMRWAVAAEDICFVNWPYAAFFGLGQSIPVRRGAGIWQRSVRFAVDRCVRPRRQRDRSAKCPGRSPYAARAVVDWTRVTGYTSTPRARSRLRTH